VVSWSVKEVLSPTKEPIMSLIAVLAVNAIFATAVVATLAYVCRIPYQLDRVAQPETRRAQSNEQASAYERAAA
jgi:hypothetical protein